MQLSVPGVRTGGGVKDGRNYHEEAVAGQLVAGQLGGAAA